MGDAPTPGDFGDAQTPGHWVVVTLNGGPSVLPAREKLTHAANAATDAELNAVAEYVRNLLADLTIGGYDARHVPLHFKAGTGSISQLAPLPWSTVPVQESLPPTAPFVDTQCVIKRLERPKVTTTSTLVVNKCYYLCELAERQVNEITWVPTGDNPSDIEIEAHEKIAFNEVALLLYGGVLYRGSPQRPVLARG